MYIQHIWPNAYYCVFGLLRRWFSYKETYLAIMPGTIVTEGELRVIAKLHDERSGFTQSTSCVGGETARTLSSRC